MIVDSSICSGKSSFCMAALRELVPRTGAVHHLIQAGHKDGHIRIAYVEQNPWILAGTVLENITFGEPYDPVWFQEVVRLCALKDDLAVLTDGEHTMIGERGITLR
jgi:ABC-type multidrug transport system fused ATPase/permease subunit